MKKLGEILVVPRRDKADYLKSLIIIIRAASLGFQTLNLIRFNSIFPYYWELLVPVNAHYCDVWQEALTLLDVWLDIFSLHRLIWPNQKHDWRTRYLLQFFLLETANRMLLSSFSCGKTASPPSSSLSLQVYAQSLWTWGALQTDMGQFQLYLWWNRIHWCHLPYL